MGSGSSKSANTNNNAVKGSDLVSRTKNDTNKLNESPKKENGKNEDYTNSPAKNNNKQNRSTSNRNSPKKTSSLKNNKWESDDSDFEDDLDDFINDTVTSSAKAISRDDEPIARPRTSHGRSARASNNAYPETYAQRIAREQYNVEKGMMSRQKTMIRDPKEWKKNSDDEEDDKHGGFDASKFRKINKHQSDAPVSNVDMQDNVATAHPVHQQKSEVEDYGIYQRDLKEKAKRRLSRLPSYSTEEQKLMEELLNSEF